MLIHHSTEECFRERQVCEVVLLSPSCVVVFQSFCVLLWLLLKINPESGKCCCCFCFSLRMHLNLAGDVVSLPDARLNPVTRDPRQEMTGCEMQVMLCVIPKVKPLCCCGGFRL